MLASRNCLGSLYCQINRVFLQGPRPAKGGFLEQLVECVSRAHSLP